MRVVINVCYGGFGVSRAGLVLLKVMENKHALKEDLLDKGHFLDGSYLDDIPRDDKDLVKLVQESSEVASGDHASLAVVEIPDGVSWHVEDYDGQEHIAENHRTWYAE